MNLFISIIILNANSFKTNNILKLVINKMEINHSFAMNVGEKTPK